MTVSTSDSSVIHDGNGVTTTWPYTFRIPTNDAANVGLFDIATGALFTLDPADYTISGVGDVNGGDVEYPLMGAPVGADKRVVIWREVPYIQETEFTNQAPYQPKVLELQLDLIVMQVQQLLEEANRSLKVTLGSELDPDEFIEQLQQGAAEAAQSAADAAASEAAAAASAASIDPDNLLKGFSNKIINGDFDIWQRGISSAAGGFLADRWTNPEAGANTIATDRQAFALGQTVVPGNPRYFTRATVSVADSAASAFCMYRQPIEGVQTLATKLVTVTFYAKADAAKSVALELRQDFGTGGSPSALVSHSQKINLTTAWQRFDVKLTLTSVSGKTLGTNGDDKLMVIFWLSAGSDYNAITDTLGTQTILFDLAHVSLVKGDATALADPFVPRHLQQEWSLCQRFYTRFSAADSFHSFVSGVFFNTTTGRCVVDLPTRMRIAPTVVTSGAFRALSGSIIAISALNGSGSADTVALSATVVGATAGNALVVQANNDAAAYIEFIAEL